MGLTEKRTRVRELKGEWKARIKNRVTKGRRKRKGEKERIQEIWERTYFKGKRRRTGGKGKEWRGEKGVDGPQLTLTDSNSNYIPSYECCRV